MGDNALTSDDMGDFIQEEVAKKPIKLVRRGKKGKKKGKKTDKKGN